MRADERTRTADLISLRVIGHVLQGLAQECKSPYLSRFLFSRLPRVAPYCVPGGISVYQHHPRIDLRLRIPFARPLESSVEREEPTHRARREPRGCRWASQLQTHPTRHARTFLRARRACANQRRQRVCTVRSRHGRRRVQANPQRPDRVLARQS
jgi:hypothetical protein